MNLEKEVGVQEEIETGIVFPISASIFPLGLKFAEIKNKDRIANLMAFVADSFLGG